MSTRIQKRRGTAAAWTSANPVLAAGEEGWETNTGKGKTGDGSTAWTSLDYDVVPDVLGTFVPQSSIAVVAAPTGVVATDDASWVAALASVSAGGMVIAQPGTYILTPSSVGKQVPNNVTVWIPAGTTIKNADNIATGAGTYVMFSGVSAPPTNIHFVIDGLIDGNRRGGNHGLSEVIFGISLSDAQDCTVTGSGRFYNFRGDAIAFGHDSTIPKGVRVLGLKFEDVGVKEGGDSANARQGVSFNAGTDCIVDLCSFDTIGAYAIDFEGDQAGDDFDGITVGDGCTFRGCGLGFVNIASAGTITNVHVPRYRAADGLNQTANTIVIPAALRRVQTRLVASGTDLSLAPGDDQPHDLPAPWPGDITLADCYVGDWIEANFQGMWGNTDTFRNLCLATMIAGSSVNYITGGATFGSVPAWRGGPGGFFAPFGGVIKYQLVAGDIAADGTVVLRPRYSLNGGGTDTMYGPLFLQVELLGTV